MSPEPDLAAGLPDELPGQSNCAEAASSSFTATGNRSVASPAALFGGVWNNSNPAVCGLSLGQSQPQPAVASAVHRVPSGTGAARPLLPSAWLALSPSRMPLLRPASSKPVLNEVVCGTLMLAYERAGLWEQVRRHIKQSSCTSQYQCFNPRASQWCGHGSVEAAAIR